SKHRDRGETPRSCGGPTVGHPSLGTGCAVSASRTLYVGRRPGWKVRLVAAPTRSFSTDAIIVGCALGRRLPHAARDTGSTCRAYQSIRFRSCPTGTPTLRERQPPHHSCPTASRSSAHALR